MSSLSLLPRALHYQGGASCQQLKLPTLALPSKQQLLSLSSCSWLSSLDSAGSSVIEHKINLKHPNFKTTAKYTVSDIDMVTQQVLLVIELHF